MEYTMIDNPDEIAIQSLRGEALRKEELAFQAECQYDEARMTGTPENTSYVEERRLEAARLRKEADTYAKAAGTSKGDLYEVRRGFLMRWIDSLERSHVAHSAVLKVKRDLDEPTADYDSILVTLDAGHAVATRKLSEIDKTKNAKK